jgi:hypothetical protein
LDFEKIPLLRGMAVVVGVVRWWWCRNRVIEGWPLSRLALPLRDAMGMMLWWWYRGGERSLSWCKKVISRERKKEKKKRSVPVVVGQC